MFENVLKNSDNKLICVWPKKQQKKNNNNNKEITIHLLRIWILNYILLMGLVYQMCKNRN